MHHSASTSQHIRHPYINGLAQDYSNSSASAIMLLQPCVKPSIYHQISHSDKAVKRHQDSSSNNGNQVHILFFNPVYLPLTNQTLWTLFIFRAHLSVATPPYPHVWHSDKAVIGHRDNSSINGSQGDIPCFPTQPPHPAKSTFMNFVYF